MVDREEFSRANFGTGKPTSPENQESYITNPPVFNRGEGTRLQTHPTGKKKIGSFNEMYKMLMLKEFEDAENLEKTVVIYPGRFHPFHKGHASVYNKLKKKFPAADVFISTSGKTNDDNSPFEFEEKKKMIQSAGIDPNFVEMTKNPYLANEITEKYNLDETNVIFAVSKKDMQGDKPRFKFGLKKDGSPSYFQPYNSNTKMENGSKHGYIATLPTMDFSILGKDIRSASEIRKLYKQSDDQGRRDLIQDLYGSMDEEVKRIFDNKLI
jgi:cytidyltransferase-like protein